MNFKTPFKVLTTAALIGTLSLSAVAPSASAATNTEKTSVSQKAATTIENVVFKTADGQYLTLTPSEYLDAKEAGVDFSKLELVAVQADNKSYSKEDYLDAKEASQNDPAKAFELLAKTEGAALEITTAPAVIEKDENGNFVVKPGTPAVDEDFKVTEIAAINAKQVKVTFSKSIPAKQLLTSVSAGTVDTNAIKVNRAVTVAAPDDTNKNVTTVTGEVSKDGKSIILTASSATYFDGAYAVTVSDKVEDTEGKKLKAYSGTVTVADATAPTIEGVEYDPTSNLFYITASEPLTAAPDTLRINGVPVTGLAVTAGTNGYTYEVSRPATVLAGTTASIYVAGAKDAAGNILTAFNGEVKIADDQSALQVAEVKQVSSNKAAIVFNKPLKSSTLADTDITALIDGKALTATTEVTYTVDSTDVTGKTVIATFKPTTTNIAAAPTYFYGTGTTKEITFVVADKSIEDVYGQKIATTTKTVTLNKDVTGPTAVSATLDRDGKGITIQLDEVVSGSVNGAVTLEALRVNGVAGDLVAVAGTPEAGKYSAKLVADEKGQLTQIKVTKGVVAALETIPSGTVQVRLAASAITDVHTNASKAISQTVTVNASTKDLEVVSNGISTTATNHFTVEYNQAVTAASALNKANYTLDGKALPEGTDIYFDSATPEKKVHIVLPTGSINIGSTSTGTSAQLAVANVKTESGKTVKSTSGTVTIKDNTSATIKSVSVTGNIIYVKFDEKLAGTLENDAQDDFVINIDGEALNVGTEGETDGEAGEVTSEIVSGQEDTVAITVKPATKGTSPFSEYVASNWNNVKKIEVSYKGTGLTDANLFTVAASKAPVANK